jgi:serine/threonine protein kinase
MNQITAFPKRDEVELAAGTRLLNGQYQILHHLQQGGFAITYLARDSLDRQVVVKECYPSGMCARSDGRVQAVSTKVEPHFETLKKQFVREARTMATLRHPNIVAVHQVFEENNSAYMALDYVAGIDLITLLEDQPNRLTPAFLEATLRQALEAVRCIHAHGILHRDIAPDNIRVDDADRITLIDFGAARQQAPAGGQTVATLFAVKDGYSPCEFYQSDATQDQSSDLYSLGATYYHLITGEIPPNCQARYAAIQAGEPDPYVPLCTADWDCGYNLLASIDRALQVERHLRPQDTADWLRTLDETPQNRPVPVREFRIDCNLEAAVSQLVRDTNQTLAPRAPKEARRNRPVLPIGQTPTAKEAARKQWVDLSGVPISDINAWLSEQEQENRRRAAEAELARAAPEPEPVLIAEPTPAPSSAPVLRGVKSLFAGLGLRGLYRSAATPTT